MTGQHSKSVNEVNPTSPKIPENNSTTNVQHPPFMMAEKDPNTPNIFGIPENNSTTNVQCPPFMVAQKDPNKPLDLAVPPPPPKKKYLQTHVH